MKVKKKLLFINSLLTKLNLFSDREFDNECIEARTALEEVYQEILRLRKKELELIWYKK